MNNLNAIYERILEVLRKISQEQLISQRRKPKLRDLELISLCLTSEYLGIDSDKGYLSAEVQLNLFETRNINLSTPMRANQHNHIKQPFVFRKSRKRIETLFSQLCDQFMIRRNYAKSFEGFKTRILSKITALTIVQYINRFNFGRNINKIKISIV